jgi:branched-chain amino acid transport system substrate-binding protein
VVLPGDELLVGTALAITGPDAAIGLDAQYGAQVALNLRGGEVMGHDVELRNEDERCAADGGTSAAAELAPQEALVGVIGTTCSEAAVTAAQVLGEKGIMLVSPSNTAPNLTSRNGDRPFYARIARSAAAQAIAAAQLACSELAVATAATLHDGSEFSARLEAVFADTFASECEGTITSRQAVAPGAEDFAGPLGAIAVSNDGSPPELLFNAIASSQAPAVMRQATATAGLEELFLVGLRDGADGRQDPYPIDAADDTLEGIYLVGADRSLSGDFYDSIFLAEYRVVSGVDEPLAAAHGEAYDAANLLLDAVEEVAVSDGGTLYIPRSALRDALLRTSGYRGLTGELACRPTGECSRQSALVWQVSGGALELAWP